MAKRLVVTRNAYLHIDRIVEFNNLRNRSNRYSQKFLKSLFKQLSLLQKLPFMGLQTSRDNVFLLIWDNYYIYYTLTEDTIEVQSIYHQKENISR